MIYLQSVTSWREVVAYLADKPCRSHVRVAKKLLVHPMQLEGAFDSEGIFHGQNNDFRLTIEGSVGLHIADFGDEWDVHLDEMSPEVSIWDHFKLDVPGIFIPVIAIAMGSLLLLIMRKRATRWQWALGGMIAAGVITLFFVGLRRRPKHCIASKYDYADIVERHTPYA